MTASTVETLKAARELIADPKRWTSFLGCIAVGTGFALVLIAIVVFFRAVAP